MNIEIYRMGIEWGRIEPEENKFNDEVERAVKAFQMSIVSGVADAETINKLKSAAK
jgi:beta-glucosidase/6-phospho-beta-glucosidase/beta-galactosidase